MAHDHAHDHHDHDHGHDHAHGAGHVHAPANLGKAFAIGIALNAGFVLIEAAYGFLANSVALLADAGHNLSDVLGLLIAWGATLLMKRRPTLRYTYGFGSSTILAALANAVLLLIAVGAIILEAVQRLGNSAPPVNDVTIIIVASIGILINGFTAWLFVSGTKHDVNIRGAYLHMAADAAVSLGVVLAGFAMLATGWDWLDPVVSLVVAGVIVWGTWGLLKDTMRLALHGVPARISTDGVRSKLVALPGVESVHDLHIWPMSTTETALTCHLVMPAGHPGDAFIVSTAKMLQKEFDIRHSTLQFEVGPGIACGSECSV